MTGVPTASFAASFTASRRDLTDPGRPVDPAWAPARPVVLHADRHAALVAATPGRLRCVDVWWAGDAVVSHAAARSPDDPTAGAICPCDLSPALLGGIVEALVGRFPTAAATGEALDVGPLVTLTPEVLDAVDLAWLLVVVTSDSGATVVARRSCDGLLATVTGHLDRAVTLAPVDAAQAWTLLAANGQCQERPPPGGLRPIVAGESAERKGAERPLR